jgi:REP element-mobilizing transposase RayT
MNNQSQFRHDQKQQHEAQPSSGGAGVPPAVFLPPGTGLQVRSRRLPHWEVEGAVYLVTFRLADSLPKQAIQKLDWERKDILATASKGGHSLSAVERERMSQLLARRVERALDAGAGEYFLRNPAIAKIVANALKEFEGSRYWLFAWSLMPNHVHVLFQTIGKIPLATILHSWKSFSAKAANKILRRSGDFWQREYYDHLIRNQNEFDRGARYVLENPSKAGLKDWPWVWFWDGVLPAPAGSALKVTGGTPAPQKSFPKEKK